MRRPRPAASAAGPWPEPGRCPEWRNAPRGGGSDGAWKERGHRVSRATRSGARISVAARSAAHKGGKGDRPKGGKARAAQRGPGARGAKGGRARGAKIMASPFLRAWHTRDQRRFGLLPLGSSTLESMKYRVYILHSDSLKLYYSGFTERGTHRLKEYTARHSRNQRD